MEFEDIIYQKKDGIAKIIINRPQVLNAFRSKTIQELVAAFEDVDQDGTIAVVVFTGSGNRSFCTGGDFRETGEQGGYGKGGMPRLHHLIRWLSKPVIAAVNGYAIGHGNIFCSLCDLAIASENATFSQVGPKVGSGDMGSFASELLARNIGEKKAKEMWYLCQTYNAQEAREMGLVNKVVPQDKLEEEVEKWCQMILQRSPTAIKRLKMGFSAQTEHVAAFEAFSGEMLRSFWTSEEALEGRRASMQKRNPDFSRFRK